MKYILLFLILPNFVLSQSIDSLLTKVLGANKTLKVLPKSTNNFNADSYIIDDNGIELDLEKDSLSKTILLFDDSLNHSIYYLSKFLFRRKNTIYDFILIDYKTENLFVLIPIYQRELGHIYFYDEFKNPLFRVEIYEGRIIRIVDIRTVGYVYQICPIIEFPPLNWNKDIQQIKQIVDYYYDLQDKEWLCKRKYSTIYVKVDFPRPL